MEQTVHTPEVYDFRQHDRVWQRVNPGLEPWSAASAMAELPGEELPGAMPDPCCMGTAAAEMTEVVAGYLEESLESARAYRCLLPAAPAWARPRLRELAAEKDRHGRTLAAVYYLITGTCYRPRLACGSPDRVGWCAALRQRYHAEACAWMNYERSAEGTTDPCLQRIFRGLSADARRHADWLLTMLEKSLRNG